MDRDKVVKGMEQFRSDIKPFCGGKADWERFDAGLSMLKEQETVEHALEVLKANGWKDVRQRDVYSDELYDVIKKKV